MLGCLMARQGPHRQQHSTLAALYLPALVLAPEIFIYPGLVRRLQKGSSYLAREEDHGFCLFGVGL